jgi:CubicO group peptidase (beta-lactamase class C family)
MQLLCHLRRSARAAQAFLSAALLALAVTRAAPAHGQVPLGGDVLHVATAVFDETEDGSPSRGAERTVPAGVRLSAEGFEAAAEHSEAAAGRALLVVQGGAVLFERYADGWTAERPHPLASGTKSFSGVLAMAAIEDGLIAGLDTPASAILSEWAEDPAKSAITVRQLLDLSSGLAPHHDSLGRQGYGIEGLGPVNSLAQRLRRREEPPADRFAAAVAVPMERAAGAEFAYGPTHFYAFGALLQRALDTTRGTERGVAERTVFEYLARRVFAPAGIDVGLERFAPDAAGRPNLPGGGHLTAREWAHFGEFVLRGGSRIEPDGTVVHTFEAGVFDPLFVPSVANRSYGLTWWLLNGEPGTSPDVADDAGFDTLVPRPSAGNTGRILDAEGREIAVAMAAGAGKQRLYLVPELELVVVRFAEMRPAGRKFDDTVFVRALLGLP